jgi:Big-like domain-containing protein/K319-like protein
MQINLFLLRFVIFFILIGLSLLNISMFLTSAQQATAQTSTTTSLQSTHVFLTDRSTRTSQSYDGPRTVKSTIPYQLIENPNKKSTWQNVALAPNTVPNNLHTNRNNNCTTLNATSSSKAPGELLLSSNSTFDLPIGGNTYPITYNITGNDNELKNITAHKDNATLILIINSTKDGKLTIDLPRDLIDSKKQGNKDNPYEVTESSLTKISCNEIKSTQQSRTLSIDFYKGIVQIAITGTNIFPSEETPPVAVLGEAEQMVNESLPVILNGSGSYDPDHEQLTFAWKQTAGPIVMLKGDNTSRAAFTAPIVANDTKMSFNLRVKDTAGLSDNANESVIVKHTAQPPPSSSPPAAINATSAFHTIFDSKLPYFFIAVIASAMVIPLAIDMIFAYIKKPKQSTDRENTAGGVVGMPGLYRTLMTFGVILLVGTILFYILTLITLNIGNLMNPALQSLIDVFKNLATILGTALATIIAFYFGMRGSETAAEKAAVTAAATASATKSSTEDKTPPAVLDTSPGNDDNEVPVSSLVTASFSKRMNPSTIDTNTFIVRKDGTTNNIPGTVHLSPDGKTAIFRSQESFSPNTKYVAIIDIAVKDEAGNALASTKTWSFKTKE